MKKAPLDIERVAEALLKTVSAPMRRLADRIAALEAKEKEREGKQNDQS